MKDSRDDAARWKELARNEPYFAVLGNGDDSGSQGSSIANEAFFKTGEDDIAALFTAMTSLFSQEMKFDSALDFGCGAGRLTLPLARRVVQVTACDIAPAMLSHARQNAEEAGLHNITYKLCDDAGAPAGASFDFICSLLVFQYIRPAVGYELIRSLTMRLIPNGIAAFQLRLHGTSKLHRFARLGRGRLRFARNARTARAPARFRQIYRYDERLVARAVEAAGAAVVAQLPAGDGRRGSAVVIVRGN